MNYRHIYHAGNFADVVKHLVFVLCLDHMRKKDKPFFVLDAQAGCGLYDLNSEQAQKTKEYQPAIGALMAVKSLGDHEDAALYFDLVRSDFARGFYPGSPVLAARMLREQDRMVANELHPEDINTLRSAMKRFANVSISHADAYEVLNSRLPPKERRGVVLVDPAYEIDKNEYEIIVSQMKQWKKRWATGTYVLWYPVKDSLPIERLRVAARELDIPNTWLCEYRDANLPPLPQSDRGDRARMRSTGVIVFNAPYTVPERAEAVLDLFAPVMGGSFVSDWLTRG